MLRRNFIRNLTIGLVGIGLAPETIWKVPAFRSDFIATEFLRRKYNEYVKGRGAKITDIYVSKELYEKFESELISCQRFTNSNVREEPTLVFKSATLHQSKHLQGLTTIFYEANGYWIGP